MTTIKAAITMSLDGYVAGPDDRVGQGLGVGGEALHGWMFGTEASPDRPAAEPTADDVAWRESMLAAQGAVIGGRRTYELAEHWGDRNPYPVPMFIVTH